MIIAVAVAVGAWVVGARRGSALLLRLLGWRDATDRAVHPPWRHLPDKYVVLGEPHTHLVDVLFMWLLFKTWRVEACFPVNRKWFVPGVGTCLRSMGAFAVNTGRKGGMVAQLVRKFKEEDRMVLHIPPSGTRKRTGYWRSGFYHVAIGAGVPVVPAWLDASTRTYGYGAPYALTGDQDHDVAHFRRFYADKRGFVPANESTIVLRTNANAASPARL